MNRHYPLIAKRAGHRCEYCRAPEVVFNFPFEVEHVVPTARGGSDAPDNLALACRACNSRKGDGTTARNITSGEDVPFFNPRTDRWAEHFWFESETGELVGLSTRGHATSAGLDMNHTLQQTARVFWVQLRLYP
ncbi:MAG TPA: HNH endonuclease [Gemmata sp.]